jgi:tetratricopeptide (TPR) repeat protein
MWQLDIPQDSKLNALAAPSLAEAGLLIVSLRCERQRPERVRALIDERLAQIVNPECALVVTVKKHRRQGSVGTDAVGRDVGHRYAARDSGALCRNAVPPLRCTLMTDKLSAAMQIAERVHSLALEHDDPTLMIGAYNTLAVTLYHSGDFEASRQYAMCAVRMWRSGDVQSHTEGPQTLVFVCLCVLTGCEWHLGEIASCQATIAEAISLAKELNDMNALAIVLSWAANMAANERNPAEVDRFASDLIELSTRNNFVFWLAIGTAWRGWARSASGNTAEGIPWIEQGIRDCRATGAVLSLQHLVGLKAEALYLADRPSEALEAISEAESLAERIEHRDYGAELHRLRGVFLTALGADEAQIEASFCAAISTAKQQKSISLEKRAEATYAEYCRQKASGSGGRGFRLPLW